MEEKKEEYDCVSSQTTKEILSDITKEIISAAFDLICLVWPSGNSQKVVDVVDPIIVGMDDDKITTEEITNLVNELNTIDESDVPSPAIRAVRVLIDTLEISLDYGLFN
jgi:hypothetical protein